MWIFSTSLRRWVFMTVALPALGAGAHWLGNRVERKRGPGRLSQTLHQAGDLAGRKRRTPRGKQRATSSRPTSPTCAPAPTGNPAEIPAQGGHKSGVRG
jgi:hypothetical protein